MRDKIIDIIARHFNVTEPFAGNVADAILALEVEGWVCSNSSQCDFQGRNNICYHNITVCKHRGAPAKFVDLIGGVSQ